MYERTNEGATKGGRDDIPMYDRTNAGEGGQPEVHSQSTRETERSGILCSMPANYQVSSGKLGCLPFKRIHKLWVHFGCTLGALWVHFGCILGALWVHFGCTLGALWVIFRPKNVKHF